MGTQADRDLALYTQWLGLAEFEVAEVVEDRALKQRRLVVVPSHRVGVCPLCHKACDQRHMHHDQCEVTDLPMASFATTLVVRVWQFYCDRCGKFFTPHYEAITAGVHVTERCLERMADMIRFSDIRNTAKFFGVAEKTLEHWYYAFLERQAQAPGATGAGNKPLESLGIDELSLKKNTGNSAPC